MLNEAEKLGDLERLIQLDRVRLTCLLEFPMSDRVEQQIAFVDAIVMGDVAGAKAAMRLHLNNVLVDLSKIATTNPDLFV